MSNPTLNITALQAALAAPTNTQTSTPIVDNTNTNKSSTNAAENTITGSSTNTPAAYINGLASTSATGLKKANESISHACDSSSYVGMAANGLGAIAGAFIREIRAGIKALLEALGISPSGSALANKLKKIAQYIKDVTNFILKITNAMQQIITYINAIKQLITYILTLPAVLLKYFADCIKTLEKQLVAGYKGAFSDSGEASDSDLSALSGAVSDVQSSISQFTQSVVGLTANTAALSISLTSPVTVSTGNTQAQQVATSQVFASLGFSSTTNNFGKA
jgi:hypothetical protein